MIDVLCKACVPVLLMSLPVGGAEPSERAITVSLEAPSPLWKLTIQEVYQGTERLFVVAKLVKRDGMGAQVITKLEDSVTLPAPHLPVHVFLLGKTWNWQTPDSMRSFANREDLDQALADSKRLYSAENK